MNQEEFIRRLQESHWPHWREPIGRAEGGRVYAVGAREVWIVDFFADGSIETDVYALVDRPEESISEPSQLERLFGRMARAWKAAADDLGIRFVSPFTFQMEDGTSRSCTGYLPDFGGPNGAVIISREDADDTHDLAEASGFYASGLNPRYYERYDRGEFIETLDDWGWFGEPGEAPTWFRGGLRRHGGAA